MNNKSEKTFSDLFLNSNDEELKKDEVTFDVFSNNVNDEEKVSSFSSFSDIANIDSDNIKDNEENKNELEVKEEPNIFNIVSNAISEENNESLKVDSLNELDISHNSIKSVEINEEVNQPEQVEESQNIFGLDSSDTKVEKTETVEEVQQPEQVEESENIFGLDSSDTKVEKTETVEEVEQPEQVEESENIFGLDNSDTKVEKTETVEEVNQPKQVEESENIFGLDNSDAKVETTETVGEVNQPEQVEEFTNVFGLSNFDTKVESIDNTEIVNQVEEEKRETTSIFDVKNTVSKSVDTEKVNNSNSSSPFFENESESDTKLEFFNPLLSNTISLDESSKNKTNVGKIELNKTKNFSVKVVPKQEPLIKFLFGVISYAFFIWLLLIGITLLVYVLDIKIRASKGDYSSPVFNAYVVLTGSMLPDIQVNDVVVTKKVDAEDLEVGDIITFASADSRFAGTIITHRIIKINPSTDDGGITFQTKGDNNNVADSSLVPETNIYGKVILKIPKLGYLQEFLASDGGWIIVILIPCLTVISYDIVKLIKGLKRKKYDNIKVKK